MPIYQGPIFDADNHYYEAHDAFTRHVPPKMLSRCVEWVELDGGRRYHSVGGKVDRGGNPTFNPIAKPGVLREYFNGNPRGMTTGELIQAVQLPDLYRESYFQTQFYGLAEHHVRQIHAGLRGWFDGDEATLFPTPPAERAEKLVAGFGGADVVRAQIADAVATDDLRWALEMATWLVRLHDVHDDDRARSADILRHIAQRTTAANVRNWCLTRARHLDGSARTDRFHTHRFDRHQAISSPLGAR